jgi:Ca2+-binding RTX toxin-like protein
VHGFAAGTFTDPDAGDTVRYSLRMAGGAALPDWLAFDAQARTFTARPGATHAGSLRLELRGSDRYGVTAGAGLTLVVTDPVQRGTSGDDTLVASAFGDTLIGGPGQDQLLGGILGDTYRFAPGDGRDTITEKAASAGMVDRLVFGNGIAPADITARRAGEDMVLAHHNGLDQITVKAWFTAAQPWVEQVLFADQTVWTAAAMTRAALVVAGTAGDDVLLGTAMNDTLRGLAGADTLQGAGGSDLLDGGDGHDVLATGAGAIGTVLLGADGNDRLSADPSARNTVFEGGRGGDSAQGSDHADTYRFRLGDGRDWITESETGTPTGAQDVLEFGPGIAPADIRVWRYANDLYFSHANGTDQVTVGDWFASTANFSATARRLESVRFADGSSWSASELTAAALVVHGTEVRDTLTGSDMDDILYGLGGDDRLSGGRGRNLLDGGEGDDLLIADDGKFTVVSFAGMFPIVRDYWASNLLRGGTGNDTLWATALARDTVFEGGPGNDTLIGSAYNDRYHFGLGDGRDTITETAPTAGHTDEIRFGPGILPGDIRVARAEGDLLLAHANGRDQITVAGWFLGAGQRIEALRFDNGTVWNEAAVQAALPVLIAGSAAADVLTGTAGADDIQGLAGHDVLNGLGGADRLQGGTGNDRLHGGDGADFLLGDAPGEVALAESITSLVVHARGTVCEGQWPTMEVWLSGTRVHSISVDSNQWAAYAVPVPPGISAHSIDIVFTNDAYRPDLGQDRNLYVDRVEVNGRTLAAGGAGVVVDFGTGVGAFDGFNTSVGYGVLSSHGALRIGLGGNDQLDGGAGVDTLAGGVGNDLYLVDTSADSIVELPGAGHDIVRATVSYVLAPHLEDLELSGANAFSATGNAGVNTLRGTPWANRLDGAGGADMLVGGAGDDTYVVDDTGDRIYELPGGGEDSVESSISFGLGTEVEHLTLVGQAAIHGTGNSLHNTLRGNAAANTLSGGTGNDTLQGGAGSDRLLGGEGSDMLVGDAPGETPWEEPVNSLVVFARGTVCEGVWPTMEVWLGGAKLQTFSVQSVSFSPYTVVVAPGTRAGAVDIVFTNDAYRPDLGQDRNLHVDRIDVNGRSISASGAGSVLDFGTGAAAFDGANTALGYGVLSTQGALRIGLNGNDLLDGGAGADTMSGGLGADVYLVDHLADTVIEGPGAGHDIVRSTVSHTLAAHVEDLELTGIQAIHGTGNVLPNTVRGNAAANRLDGGAGSDLLVGGAGSDTYFLGRGWGADGIYENDTTPGNTDVAAFGADIAFDQLWFRRQANNLEVSVIGTGDRLSISGWYSTQAHRLEQFHAGDGRMLLDSQVHTLVNAMAAFAPPPMGQYSLSAAYREQLAPVLAASWQ